MGKPRTSSKVRQRRGIDELRCQILKACLHTEQSTSKLARILNASARNWVKKHVQSLVRAGFLSMRVVQNGDTTANMFRTTQRGQQLMEHLESFSAS
jgi:predicted transcriptional regulator